MKHSGETTFSIDDRVICYSDETQNDYVMQFLDLMPKLHTLIKLTQNLSIWHGRVDHLRYKDLLRMAKYIVDVKDVSGPTPNEIFGWWMMGCQQQEICRIILTKSTVFLDLLHFELEKPLPRTFWRYRYCLLINNNATVLMFFKLLHWKDETFGELFQLKTFFEL